LAMVPPASGARRAAEILFPRKPESKKLQPATATADEKADVPAASFTKARPKHESNETATERRAKFRGALYAETPDGPARRIRSAPASGRCHCWADRRHRGAAPFHGDCHRLRCNAGAGTLHRHRRRVSCLCPWRIALPGWRSCRRLHCARVRDRSAARHGRTSPLSSRG